MKYLILSCNLQTLFFRSCWICEILLVSQDTCLSIIHFVAFRIQKKWIIMRLYILKWSIISLFTFYFLTLPLFIIIKWKSTYSSKSTFACIFNSRSCWFWVMEKLTDEKHSLSFADDLDQRNNHSFPAKPRHIYERTCLQNICGLLKQLSQVLLLYLQNLWLLFIVICSNCSL